MRLQFSVAMVWLTLCLSIPVSAQDIDVSSEIIVSDPIILGELDLSVGDGAFISDINFGDFGGLGGGGTESADLMRLLRASSIRDELEMADYQYEKMQKFAKESQAEMKGLAQSLFKKISQGGKLEGGDDLVQQLRKASEGKQSTAKAGLEEMLLPHQVERLKQIAFQVSMKKKGAAKAMMSGALAEALDLSADQKKELQQKSKEVQKRLDEEIAKLRATAREEVISVLSEEQRGKLKKLMGEEFESKKERPSKL